MGTHPIFESDFDCLTEMSRSSTARIEQRVRKKIEDGEFYEAHQMYRTIFSRQKQNKFLSNALRIAFEGACQLFDVKENGSAGDLCLLYCSGLDEIAEGEEYEKLCSKIHEQVQKLHYYTLTHLDIDQPERDQFEKHIITWSANKSGSRFGSPALREAVGDNYWTFVHNNRPDDAETELSLYVNARNNLLISGNAIKLADFTVEFSAYASKTDEEVQFFCMQTVFQLLTRNEPQNASIFFENFVKHKNTKFSKFPFDGLPLMNLAYFLLAAIKMKNQKTYFVLLQNYAPILHSPDPSYIHYMRKIGIMYFGVKPKTQPKKQGGLMGMIQNMMSELGAPDDSDEDGNSSGAPNLNSLMSMANNMLGNMSQSSQNQSSKPKPTPPPRDEDVDDLD